MTASINLSETLRNQARASYEQNKSFGRKGIEWALEREPGWLAANLIDALEARIATTHAAGVAEGLEKAARVADWFGPSRPLASRNPKQIEIGRWEGEQTASQGIATTIRAIGEKP